MRAGCDENAVETLGITEKSTEGDLLGLDFALGSCEIDFDDIAFELGVTVFVIDVVGVFTAVFLGGGDAFGAADEFGALAILAIVVSRGGFLSFGSALVDGTVLSDELGVIVALGVAVESGCNVSLGETIVGIVFEVAGEGPLFVLQDFPSSIAMYRLRCVASRHETHFLSNESFWIN